MAFAYVQSHFDDDPSLKRLLIGLCLALAWPAAATPALAQFDPVTATATAEFLKSSGPWGLVAVCFTVIGLLWRKNTKLSDDMTAFLTKRGDEADTRADKLATVATTATNAITKATEATQESVRKQEAVAATVALLPPAIATIVSGLDRNARLIEDMGRNGGGAR